VQVLRTEESPGTTAARDARRAAARWLSAHQIGGDLADRVILVVSELVTNSLRHARTGFVLSLAPAGTGVRVEVFDADTREPIFMAPDDGATGGRGIHIVSEIAAAWGSAGQERDGVQGKIVWAVID
jgi:two-component sensor histidine kinase